MNKYLKWFLGGCAIGLAGLVVLFFTWGIITAPSEGERLDTAESSEISPNESEPAPMLEEVKTETEAEFMRNLHYMTHQKVYANEKWGSLEITGERIETMLKALDEEDYENESFYREALNEWSKGNFNNAVEVHNKIWSMQGGTIGKAKRLLSEREEKAYREANFN